MSADKFQVYIRIRKNSQSSLYDSTEINNMLNLFLTIQADGFRIQR